MTYTPRKDTQFSGTEKLTNLTTNSGGTVDMTASTTVSVPTVAGTTDSSNKAASTAYVQAVAGTLATQAYVDTAVQRLDAKASVKAATTAALAITGRTSTTLTLGGTTLTIDGVTMANGDRVLVKDSTTGTGAGTWDNGIYTISGIGSSVVLTRDTDSDTWAELVNAYCWVERGTANADKGYVCTSDQGGTLGTTAVTFVTFNTGSLTAGTGITISGGQVSIDTSVVPQLAANNTFTGTTQTIQAAGTVTQTVKSTSGAADINIDAFTGFIAQLNFKVNGSAAGAVQASATSMSMTDSGGLNAISITDSSHNVVLGNGTGTLTSNALDFAANDFSAKLATSQWVNENRRGGMSVVAVANASFPYNVASSDDIIVMQQTAAHTGSNGILLPAASSVRVLRIKDGSASGAATFNVDIKPNGTDTIDGLSSYTINQNLESLTLVSDGSGKWWLV